MTLVKSPAESRQAKAASGSGRNLLLRVASAIVLAPAAVITTYWGGIPFVLFWLAAAAAVLWEWFAMVGGGDCRVRYVLAAAALSVAAIIILRQYPLVATLIVLLGMPASALFAPSGHRKWIMAGVGYSGVLLLAPALLRLNDSFGFVAIMFLFAIVWTTDVLAYFVGRALGGPKLSPGISPGKTWSGAIGGAAGAVIVSYYFAGFFDFAGVVPIAAIGLCLSVLSQLGDLLESAIKRKFDVKDASHLIPGHGGVMDRLDGFWAAAIFALAIGLLRGGFEAPARGLLVW